MIYYSPSNKGFYDTEFFAYTLPDDIVEISKEQYKTLLGDTNIGKVVVMSGDELVGVHPEVTEEQLLLVESLWVQNELIRAGEELNKVQDGDLGAKGTVGDWRAYRKSLRAWPLHDNFPNREFRPASPDV